MTNSAGTTFGGHDKGSMGRSLAVAVVAALGGAGVLPTALWVAAASAGQSYVFSVNSTADGHDANSGDGECATASDTCTVRAALEAASALGSGSQVTIDIPAGTYDLTLGSLVAGANTVIVDGAGASATIIDAKGASRVLVVAAGASATLDAVTLTGGNPGYPGYGGGVLNSGQLSVKDSGITGDTATSGGGLSNAGGTMTIVDSTIADDSDSEGYGGGGIQNGGVSDAAGSVTVVDSTLSGDTASDDGGAILNGQNGHPSDSLARRVSVVRWRTAGRWSRPASSASAAQPRYLTVTGSTFSADSSANAGGGIANDGGIVSVGEDVFEGDSAKGAVGGAVFSYGNLSVTRSNFTKNVSCYGGAMELITGGIASSATVSQSTLSANTGCVGGAIDDSDSVTVSQSTLGRNSAQQGAAVEVEGGASAYLTNSTIYDNVASSGDAAFQTYGCASGTLSFDTFSANSSALDLSCQVTTTGTILAGSTDANCLGSAPVETTGYNLDSGKSCGLTKSSDLTRKNPLLGALAPNGGPTDTQSLRIGSPAIDRGGSHATGCPKVDQRRVRRPQGSACDIGAFEKRA